MTENADKFIRLKANKGRTEIQVGDVHVAADPGQIVKVDLRQFAVAIASGHFKAATKPAPRKRAPKATKPADAADSPPPAG